MMMKDSNNNNNNKEGACKDLRRTLHDINMGVHSRLNLSSPLEKRIKTPPERESKCTRHYAVPDQKFANCSRKSRNQSQTEKKRVFIIITKITNNNLLLLGRPRSASAYMLFLVYTVQYTANATRGFAPDEGTLSRRKGRV